MKFKIPMESIQRQLNWTLVPKFLTPALLIAVLKIAIDIGGEVQRIQGLTFDNQEQKIKTIELVENHMTSVEVYQTTNRIKELEKAREEFAREIQELKETLHRIEDKLDR